jgi:cobalt-zinc-cadmium efflux system protein
MIAMSAHVEVSGARDWHTVLLELSYLLAERFGILHSTLQPEQPETLPDAFRGCSIETPEGRAACRVPRKSATSPNHSHAAH